MTKSISSFVLGLVFSIIGAIAGYVLWLIGTFVGAFSTGMIQTIFLILPIINLVTFIISFTGCFFCLWKARIGGIIMFIASTISLICLITIFITFKDFSFVYFLFLSPTIVLFVNSINAISKKHKTQHIETKPQEISQKN